MNIEQHLVTSLDLGQQSENLHSREIHLNNNNSILSVKWKIPKDSTAMDWIGLYLPGESNPLNYLDFQTRGIGKASGTLQWRIDADKFKNANYDESGRISACFKYYNGVTGVLKAASPVLTFVIVPTIIDTYREVATSDITFTIEEVKFYNYSRNQTGTQHFTVKVVQANRKVDVLKPNLVFEIKGPSRKYIDKTLTYLTSSKMVFELRQRGSKSKPQLICVAKCEINLLEMLQQAIINGNDLINKQLIFNVGTRTVCKLLVLIRIHQFNQYSASGSSSSASPDMISSSLHLEETGTKTDLSDQPSVASVVVETHTQESSSPSYKPGQTESKNVEKVADLAKILKNPFSVCQTCQSSMRDVDNNCRRKTYDLPYNWEARVDHDGRVVYVDHKTKTTSWRSPSKIVSEGSENTQLDSSRMTQPISAHRSVALRQMNTIVSSPDWPAISLLTRSDFSTIIQQNTKARDLYTQSDTLKHVIHRIRTDANKYFDRYQNDVELIAFVNAFADLTAPLPRNWEVRCNDSGVKCFIDHHLHRTTMIDPRLPQQPAVRRKPTRPSSVPVNKTPMSYEEKVICFIKKSNLLAQIERRVPELALDPNLKGIIERVLEQGLVALRRYSNNTSLVTFLSAFENDINDVAYDGKLAVNNNMKRRIFETKLDAFYQQLKTYGFGNQKEKLKLTIRRQHLLNDAFELMSKLPASELLNKRLTIVFSEEDGLDYGGPSREFFALLSRSLFNPYYGLFEYSCQNSYKLQISSTGVFVESYKRWYQFCGRVLALALVNQFLLDAFFTAAFYKVLLNKNNTLDDIYSVDPQFYSGLLWVLRCDGVESLDLTFSVNEIVNGEPREKDLVPNGKDLPVTMQNKEEYVDQMVQWRIHRGTEEQMSSLVFGFKEILDCELLKWFEADDLELILCGTVEIDIEDWTRYTDYKSGYHPGHTVIMWFWKAVEQFTNEQRLQLLQFVTGTSSIPCEGFGALRSSNGAHKFTIERWGGVDDLPRAHTCFNRLDLPPYPTFNTLVAKLSYAMEETSYYAIE